MDDLEQDRKNGREEAQQRVGTTQEERLRWLVDFAQEDLSSLSRGRALDLDDEISAFTFAGLPGDVGEQVVGQHYEAGEDERDLVRKLQQRWREALQALLDHRRFMYDATATYILGRDPEGSMEYGISANAEPAFFIAIFRLVSERGVRLRRCAAEGCDRIFVGPPAPDVLRLTVRSAHQNEPLQKEARRRCKRHAARGLRQAAAREVPEGEGRAAEAEAMTRATTGAAPLT